MRLFLSVLVCLGVGGVSVAMADEAPAAATQAASTAAPVTATDKPAQAPASDSFEKQLLAQGYKAEMHNGQKQYCRKEGTLGSRLGDTKHCGTLEELKISTQVSRSATDKIQQQVGNHPGT